MTNASQTLGAHANDGLRVGASGKRTVWGKGASESTTDERFAT